MKEAVDLIKGKEGIRGTQRLAERAARNEQNMTRMCNSKRSESERHRWQGQRMGVGRTYERGAEVDMAMYIRKERWQAIKERGAQIRERTR
jgi:hypothetical protein